MRANEKTRRLTGLALLTAIIVVLQVVASFVKFGPFTITLALAPIIIGAALYGAGAGAWLGAVFGVVVLIAFVCNLLEAGILFSDNYEGKTADEMVEILARKVQAAQIPSIIVTMGGDGAVYADREGNKGFCPARQVKVKDTAGAGDAFCAGAAIGLTYGKSLGEACEIGAHLAASVIVTSENVCPRFLPRELGLDLDVVD